MLIKILIVGKTDQAEVVRLFDDYHRRLQHYAKIEIKIIENKKRRKKINALQSVQEEGELILKELCAGSFLILLDEAGKQYSSVGFSQQLQKMLLSGQKELVFCIGGAYGFSEEVYQRASTKLALSKMTFTHQMVRLIFMEQLYRAFTILKGEKYHH